MIYVASSWRNYMQEGIVATLKAAKLDVYDFKNPPNGSGFHWSQVKPNSNPGIKAKGSDWETVSDYLAMISHPVAEAGFDSDFNAMKESDTFIMVLPCGKSAHLELGWAVGAGKRTAIFLEDPIEPELMYCMVDFMTSSIIELLEWLGVPN